MNILGEKIKCKKTIYNSCEIVHNGESENC